MSGGTPTVPVILAVDSTRGTVRLLVNGGQDGVFAPRRAALAYTASSSNGTQGTAVWIGNAQGQHARLLASGPLSSPVWAPDGTTLAYIRGGTTIHMIAVATGEQMTLTTPDLLPSGDQLLRLAWVGNHS